MKSLTQRRKDAKGYQIPESGVMRGIRVFRLLVLSSEDGGGIMGRTHGGP